MNIVTLTAEQKKLCREFANNSDVSLYLKRSRITEEKAKNDVYQGKLAEFAVADALKDRGCTQPDLEIYDTGRKRFSPDLKLADGTRVHVKCQTKEKGIKYGVSWIFEQRDSSVNKNKTGIAAFCVLNEDETISLYKIVDIAYLHENQLFKPTKLKIKGKVAVYASDLETINDSKVQC